MSDDSLIGHVFAERYQVVRVLGEGGMGSVYEAKHLALQRSVAIKVLRDDVASNTEFRRRFEREARVLSSLSHPNIVTVTDFGFDGETPFLVMDLLVGSELEALLDLGPLPAGRAANIARQLVRAVAHAHEQGLVHRDLKPQNVMVQTLSGGSDHVTVLDFGLARAVQGGATLTKSGLVLGTPAYMAPEQAAGSPADARSDVYALGLLLFELFARRRPFPQKSAPELMRAHLLTPPPPLSSIVEVDSTLSTTIARALEKEPPDRFENAGLLLAALESGLPSGPTPLALVQERGTRPAKKVPKPALVGNPRYDRADEHATDAVTESQVSAPRRGSTNARPAIIGAAVVALIAVCALAFMVMRGADENAIPPDNDTPATTVEPTSIAAAVQHQAGEVPSGQVPSDRWAAPGELQPFVTRLMEGRPLGRGQERRLGVLARRSPDDPRPRLLLAHNYASQRNLSDAFARYREAFDIDPSVASDEWVRDDLITIATAESLHRRVVDFMLEHYDASFAPAVDARIESERHRPWRERLEHLATALRR